METSADLEKMETTLKQLHQKYDEEDWKKLPRAITDKKIYNYMDKDLSKIILKQASRSMWLRFTPVSNRILVYLGIYFPLLIAFCAISLLIALLGLPLVPST